MSQKDRIDAVVEPEEVLVTDPRAGLTPVQVVELKLLTLMQTGNPGLFIQAAYTPQDIRRIPREAAGACFLVQDARCLAGMKSEKWGN